MDLLKSQFDRIQQQVSGLTASQKMLAACLVAIMVMTLVWWGRVAGTSEMEPVVGTPLTPENVSQIKAKLTASAIPYQVAGDKVLVPAARKLEALAELAVAGALPENADVGLDAIIKDMNPFASQTESEARWNLYRQGALAAIISRFPGVAKADVVVDAEQKFKVGVNTQPTGMVNIRLKPGAGVKLQDLADAARNVVCGSRSGLEHNRIKVIVNGRTVPVRDDGQGSLGGMTLVEHRAALEKQVEDNIFRLLQIEGVTAWAAVEVDGSTKTSRKTSYDPDNAIQQPSESTERSSEVSGGWSGGGEPGAVPNGSMIAGEGGSGGRPGGDGGTSTESESKTKFENRFGSEETQTHTPAGAVARVLGVSVSIPRSYLVRVLKRKADGPEPEEAAIEARFATEEVKIRKVVKTCARLASEDDVQVRVAEDLVPALEYVAGPGGGQAAAASVGSMFGLHAREVALGGLALVSLFMVSMMVRRGAPAGGGVALAAPMLAGGPTVFDVSEKLAGEAAEGRSMLDGMELDEDAIRAQQMLEQVSSMVKENPDGAASLVKRWLNRT